MKKTKVGNEGPILSLFILIVSGFNTPAVFISVQAHREPSGHDLLPSPFPTVIIIIVILRVSSRCQVFPSGPVGRCGSQFLECESRVPGDWVGIRMRPGSSGRLGEPP